MPKAIDLIKIGRIDANLTQCLNWDLQTMQAILLTEIFTRFRGRKTNVRLSRHFEELYSRVSWPQTLSP